MVFNLKNVLQKTYFKNVLKDGFIDPYILELKLTFSSSQSSSQTGPLIPVVGLIAKTLPSFELDPPTRYTENKSNKHIDVEGVELAMLILLLKYVLSYSAQTMLS